MKRMRRVTRKTVANAIHLAPLIGEWSGTATPTLLFAGRRGQLMTLDLYDNDQGNFNGAIIGTPGSGKSVWMNEIAWSYRAIDAQVRLLDLGALLREALSEGRRRVRRVRTAVRHQRQPLQRGRQHRQRHGDADASRSPRWPRSPAPLEEVQYKAINAGILRRVEGVRPRHDDHAAARPTSRPASIPDLDVNDDPRIRDLAIMLEPYTRDGQYARFFEGQANIDFSNDFMVIENEELKRAPDLHAVVNMILLYQITQDMYLSRERGDHRKKLLMIDELMQQLGEIGADDPVKARVVEEAARRARKYGGSLITATQGADDYYSSKQMETAFHFSDWVFLLRQKPESIELLGSQSPAGAGRCEEAPAQLAAHRARRVFGDLRLLTDGRRRGAAHPRPAHAAAVLQPARGQQAIDQRRARGMSIDQAIDEVLRERSGKPS